MRTITQSEFTGVDYRQTHEYDPVFEIYDQKPASKKGYVYMLMKKEKAYGIQEYRPDNKSLGRWTNYNNLGMAIWAFDKL